MRITNIIKSEPFIKASFGVAWLGALTGMILATKHQKREEQNKEALVEASAANLLNDLKTPTGWNRIKDKMPEEFHGIETPNYVAFFSPNNSSNNAGEEALLIFRNESREKQTGTFSAKIDFQGKIISGDPEFVKSAIKEIQESYPTIFK